MNNIEGRISNIETLISNLDREHRAIGQILQNLKTELSALKKEAGGVNTRAANNSHVIKNVAQNSNGALPSYSFGQLNTQNQVNAVNSTNGLNTANTFNTGLSRNTGNTLNTSARPVNNQSAGTVRPFTPTVISTKPPATKSSLAKTSTLSQTSATKPAINTSTQTSGNAVLTEYQKLIGQKGLTAMTARENFEKQYHIIGVSCANMSERFNNLNLSPIYKTDVSAKKSHIWLMKANDGKYIAFLNPSLPMGYCREVHEFAAMKDIFKSNYKTGSYSEFKIIRPAVFVQNGNLWQCESKGEIVF